jgi:hypothetical protein
VGCLDGSIDLTMSATGAPYSFAWSTSANTEDVSNLDPGTYSVTITNADGCDSVVTFDVLNAAGLNDLQGFNFYLAPNPAMDVFTIYFGANEDFEIQVQLYDAMGKIVRNSSHHIGSGKALSFSVEDLAPGTYTVHLASGHHSMKKRLVVQR